MLRDIVQEYTAKQLTLALMELLELQETGILRDGIVRETHQKLVKAIPEHPFSITTLENAILWEVAARSELYPKQIK